MKRQTNGQLGDWEANTTTAKPIEIDIKCACLELFKQGAGYRKAANTLGLKLYTVREWGRRFKIGDELWAYRDGKKFRRVAVKAKAECCSEQNRNGAREPVKRASARDFASKMAIVES